MAPRYPTYLAMAGLLAAFAARAQAGGEAAVLAPEEDAPAVLYSMLQPALFANPDGEPSVPAFQAVKSAEGRRRQLLGKNKKPKGRKAMAPEPEETADVDEMMMAVAEKAEGRRRQLLQDPAAELAARLEQFAQSMGDRLSPEIAEALTASGVLPPAPAPETSESEEELLNVAEKAEGRRRQLLGKNKKPKGRKAMAPEPEETADVDEMMMAVAEKAEGRRRQLLGKNNKKPKGRKAMAPEPEETADVDEMMMAVAEKAEGRRRQLLQDPAAGLAARLEQFAQSMGDRLSPEIAEALTASGILPPAPAPETSESEEELLL